MDKYSKNRISFLLSGHGSNLLSILKKNKVNKKLNIISIVSNNRISNEIKKFLYMNKMKTKVYENQLNLQNNFFNDASLIFSVGYLKNIPSSLITKFKVINLHPSFLPKYKGLMTHKRVLINKEKFGGFSVHIVSKYLDEGKLLSQTKYKIRTEKESKLVSAHKKMENDLVYSALIRILNQLSTRKKETYLNFGILD